MPGIADWAETVCRVWSVGYDQGNRWAIYDGGETDCTALASWCCYQAGYTPKPPTDTYSGNIVGWLMNQGFYAVPLADRRRNDVLVAVGHHAAVYCGDGMLAQASIDENGGIAGGRSGDQTGGETNYRGYYSYPWTVCLRAPDGSGNGKAEIEIERLLDMEFTYQMKGGSSQKWWDGSHPHGFARPAEKNVVEKAFKACTGKPMPFVVFTKAEFEAFEAAAKRIES